MAFSSAAAVAAITQPARALRGLTTVLVVGTAALLAWPVLVAIWFGHTPGRWGSWAELVPPIAYLCGLMQLRGAFAALADGELFGPTVRRALWRLGVALMVGAALQVLVVPNLVFWLLGPGEGGGLLRFDVAAFATGAIGAGLLLIARLFDAAQAMSAELEEFL